MQLICLLLIGSFILFSCGCQSHLIPLVSASDVLKAMLAVAHPIDGKEYQMLTEDHTKQISDELLKALYGEEAAALWTRDSAAVDDGAIYLAEVMHPYELAVFRCVSEEDIWNGSQGVLGICATRLEAVKKAWQGSEYESVATQGTVTYCGNYVILVIAEDAESIVSAAKRKIKQN